MKKTLLFYVLLILCLLSVTAGAAPAVTDGATTGWIADNNYLYFQKEDGRNLQMPMEMDDLLTMTENELICIARDQRIIAVMKQTQTTAALLQLKTGLTEIYNESLSR